MLCTYELVCFHTLLTEMHRLIVRIYQLPGLYSVSLSLNSWLICTANNSCTFPDVCFEFTTINSKRRERTIEMKSTSFRVWESSYLVRTPKSCLSWFVYILKVTNLWPLLVAAQADPSIWYNLHNVHIAQPIGTALDSRARAPMYMYNRMQGDGLTVLITDSIHEHYTYSWVKKTLIIKRLGTAAEQSYAIVQTSERLLNK